MAIGGPLLFVAGVVALLWFLRESDCSGQWKLIVSCAYVGSWVMATNGQGNRMPGLIIHIVVTLGLVVALFWDRPLSR